MASHKPKGLKGFTLLELLLALSVLAILMAMVIPFASRSYLQYKDLDQSIASVMESILLAKKLAIESSTPYVYEFAPGSVVQQIYPVDGSREKLIRTLPNGIRLELANSELGKQGRLLFREDGSTEGFSLRIIGPHQSQGIQVTRHLGVPQRTKGSAL